MSFFSRELVNNPNVIVLDCATEQLRQSELGPSSNCLRCPTTNKTSFCVAHLYISRLGSHCNVIGN